MATPICVSGPANARTKLWLPLGAVGREGESSGGPSQKIGVKQGNRDGCRNAGGFRMPMEFDPRGKCNRRLTDSPRKIPYSVHAANHTSPCCLCAPEGQDNRPDRRLAKPRRTTFNRMSDLTIGAGCLVVLGFAKNFQPLPRGTFHGWSKTKAGRLPEFSSSGSAGFPPLERTLRIS
jgi:hypothetical protein